MDIYFIVFFLSAIGISETVYLIKERKAQKTPVCIIGGDCQKVLGSKYNKTLGIYNDILGLIFYITTLILVSLLMIETGQAGLLKALLKIIIFVGLLSSFYFTYIQWRVIKAWCFWCLMSAVTTFLMAVIVLFV